MHLWHTMHPSSLRFGWKSPSNNVRMSSSTLRKRGLTIEENDQCDRWPVSRHKKEDFWDGPRRLPDEVYLRHKGQDVFVYLDKCQVWETELENKGGPIEPNKPLITQDRMVNIYVRRWESDTDRRCTIANGSQQ